MKAGAIAGAGAVVCFNSNECGRERNRRNDLRRRVQAHVSAWKTLMAISLITGGSGDKYTWWLYKKAGKQEYMDELKVSVDADEDYVSD